MESQVDKYQELKQIKSIDDFKTTIKTIINGFIVSGQYFQQNQNAQFLISSSTNKLQKYQISLNNSLMNQSLRQHFQNIHELFAYLSQSTKNRLKITNDKNLVIQVQKDKKKFSFSYSLIQHNKNNNHPEETLKQTKKQQISKQQIQKEQPVKLQQKNQELQKISHQKEKLQRKIFSQLQRDIEQIQNTQMQKKLEQRHLDEISHSKVQEEKNVYQKQPFKVDIKTDLQFVKMPRQEQTLLEFSVNSNIQPLIKLIAQNTLIHIEELVLKRFNITEIPPFNQIHLNMLKCLVLEDNRIQRIQNLQTCSSLQRLNLDSNKIYKIQNLQNLINLKFLKLGNNQIDFIQGLDSLTKLQTLWLDFNNIIKIENLQKMTSLKSLNLSFNQIQKIQNLQTLKQLSELMISDNQLTYISNLDSNYKLTRLALNSNLIQHITGLKKLLLLQNLHLIGNQISKFDKRQFEEINWLKMLKQLKLNGNGIILDEQGKGLIQRLRNYGIKVYI